MRRTKQTCESTRSGSAAVEFAICLPFCFALAFGMMETTQAIYVKRSLATAAYEAACVATAMGGTSQVAQDRANAVAALLSIKSMNITISPAVDTNTATGTQVTVTCTADLGQNSLTGWMLGNTSYSVTHVANHL